MCNCFLKLASGQYGTVILEVRETHKGRPLCQKTFSTAAWDGETKVEQAGLTKLMKMIGVSRG